MFLGKALHSHSAPLHTRIGADNLFRKHDKMHGVASHPVESSNIPSCVMLRLSVVSRGKLDKT